MDCEEKIIIIRVYTHHSKILCFLFIFRCLVHGVPFFVSLLAPICIILLFNIALLILVMRGITNSTPHNVRHSRSDVKEDKNKMKLAKITLACSVLLGLTWLFGVLAVGELTEIMQYLFCIFNSLQGFFIFIFYTLTNPEVRKEWGKQFRWETISSTFSQTSKNLSFLLQVCPASSIGKVFEITL